MNPNQTIEDRQLQATLHGLNSWEHVWRLDRKLRFWRAAAITLAVALVVMTALCAKGETFVRADTIKSAIMKPGAGSADYSASAHPTFHSCASPPHRIKRMSGPCAVELRHNIGSTAFSISSAVIMDCHNYSPHGCGADVLIYE